MRVLDLFSGIGGFSLGLERAGFKTVAFCEIDAYCRRVLAHHWPGVPIYTDVRDLDAARLRADGIDRVDAICGGFPCQDISLAGKGAGLDGERSGLWREYARLVGEIRPSYVLVENVGALRGRGLAAVLGDLAALGYDAVWNAVPAAAVGAPHLRDRVWIVAADADAQRGGQAPAQPGQHRARGRAKIAGRATADTTRSGSRLGALDGPAAADAPGPGSSQLRGLQRRLARALAAASAPWPRSAEPPLRGVDDGLSVGVDGRAARRLERDALKALGNAVVPAIPELIGRALLEGAAAC